MVYPSSSENETYLKRSNFRGNWFSLIEKFYVYLEVIFANWPLWNIVRELILANKYFNKLSFLYLLRHEFCIFFVKIIGGKTGLKNVLGQKWQPVITNYGCPKENFFAPYLNIVDIGATITLSKTWKTNHSNFTITQSKNIQIYVFETSLIQTITNLY